MKRFFNYLEEIRKQKKLTKTGAYLSAFAILLFLSLAITLPNYLIKRQQIYKSHAQAGITLNPGDNIQAAVDANPAGTTFTLNPGMYRMQTVTPKDNDAFIGLNGAVMNGSKVITPTW